MTASLFHMLMLTPDVLSQVSPFCSNVRTELAFESWHKAFVLYVVMFLQTCAVWRLGQFLLTAPYSPILPRPHNVHSWNLDYQTAQLSQRKIQSKRGDLHLGIQHRT